MGLRHHPLAKGYYRLLETALPWIRRRRIDADQMTWIGALIAASVPLGFALHPLAGLLLMLISGSADALDGRLARENRKNRGTSSWGAFLDSSLDRFSDGCYLLGFWLLFWQLDQVLAGTLLLWPALIATLMISYVKARAEALGSDCQVGLMERAARILSLCIWALCLVLLPGRRMPILIAGALIYLILTAATVAQRMVHVRRQF